MEFCPICWTMLQYELPHMGRPSRFFCPACPYVCYLENKVKIKKKQPLVKKDLEPVVTEDDMKNASQMHRARNVVMEGLLMFNFRLGQLMGRPQLLYMLE